jgi:serine/threonine protein kinase
MKQHKKSFLEKKPVKLPDRVTRLNMSSGAVYSTLYKGGGSSMSISDTINKRKISRTLSGTTSSSGIARYKKKPKNRTSSSKNGTSSSKSGTSSSKSGTSSSKKSQTSSKSHSHDSDSYTTTFRNIFMADDEFKTERSMSRSIGRIDISNYEKSLDNVVKIETFGAGKFGSVSLVKKDGKTYVQKELIKTHIGGKGQHLLINEMKFLHILRNTGVVPQLVAYENTSDRVSFIMEHNKGYVDLESFLADYKVPTSSMKRIGISILRAFSIIHGKSIVHCDVKPNNIIVHPKTLDVKIIDFGLSFIKEETTSRGTITFNCPRKLEKQKISYGTDCWSIGVTFLWMFFGYTQSEEDIYEEPEMFTVRKEFHKMLSSSICCASKYGKELLSNILIYIHKGYDLCGKTTIKRLLCKPTVRINLYEFKESEEYEPLPIKSKKTKPEESKLDKAFREAAINGDLATVKTLLREGKANPATSNNEAIIKASGNGHLNVVKALLLDGRANPAAKENEALHRASVKGYLSIVNALLNSKKVDPTKGLRGAIVSGHINVVKVLLENGASPTYEDVIIAIIFNSVKSTHSAVLKTIIAHDSVKLDGKNNKILSTVIAIGCPKTIKIFLDSGKLELKDRDVLEQMIAK